jgi:hypothetical protein
MPIISSEEITLLYAWADSAVKLASEIKDKDPTLTEQCEQIERRGQDASTLLKEILARPD